MQKELHNAQGVLVNVKNANSNADTTATIMIQNKIDYTPKVSVIIPVYNVEEYLHECLDSVINQTLKDIEIICVDDGSTDKSLDILKEYAKRDNRITVMTQQNLHAGVARNAGMVVASGEYVHFLDSDDWVEKEALEKLYNLAHSKQIDVLKFKNKMYDNVTKQFIENSWINVDGFSDEYTNKTLTIQDNISVIKLPDAPWSGIYKLSFLKDKKIYFDNLICVNDTAFFIEAVSKGSVYVTKDIRLVVYRVNNSKSLIGIRHKNFYCQLAVYNSINKRITHLPLETRIQINARTLVGIGYKMDEYFSKDLSIEDKEQIFNQVKEFFISTDVSEILNSNQNFIYPVQNILAKRQVILDSENYKDYDKKQRQNKYRSCIIKESEIDAEPKVSVIIPVYNVEKYLHECLDSVSGQTLKDIEIICVDDGSTDKSLDILKEYAKKDKRFTVISLKNGGAAISRNAGLVFAKGEFVAFMDSDDFYPASDTLEYMYKTAKQHNALICGGAMNYLKNGEIINDPKQLDEGYSFAKDGFIDYSDYQYDFGFTRFVYNRKFVYDNNIYFPEYMRFEDPIFFIKVMTKAKKFYALKRATYVYRVEYKEIQWTLKKAQDVVRGITDGLNLSKIYGLTKMHYQYASKKLHSNWLINNAFSLLPMNDNLLVNMLNAVDLELVHKIDKNYALPKYKNISSVKVSVIIPCYKVENFLSQCLDSVINQTLKDIEIICVNDGSPDNSLKILQEYASRDSRIKIISQKNQGLSCSRNNALKLVCGEYVLFLDSDDWIRQDACELLYNKSKQYDLDMVNFAGTNYNDITKTYNQLNGQKILYIQDNKDNFNRSELEKFLYNIPISACRFFYRMGFLNKHNIRFPEGINFEDNYFVRHALLFVQNFGVEREILYFRRIHGESITQNVSKFFNDYIEVLGRVEKLYETNKVKHEIIKKTLEPYFDYLYNQLTTFTVEDRKKYAPRLFAFYHKMSIKYGISNPKYGKRSYHEQPLKDWYNRVTGDVLDLDNPRTFDEKIQWSKLYDSTPIKTRLADKYLVRDWVAEKIGDKYLIPLLGVYDSFDEIDFEKLPKQFVIKCNHGCAYNIIVKDKSKLDLADVKAKLDKWMNENFAFSYGCELHYRDIKPKIIIEQFIENKKSGGDLYDYKFWCFGGKVYYIQFLSERNIDGLKMAFYNKNWEKQHFVYSHPLDKKNIEKPSNLDEMIELAERLSKDFNHVRVDFYRLDDGTIYFGEMTFTSASGTCKWNDEKINRYFGKLFKLPKLAYNMDTCEYYKLPKRYPMLSAYLLFPWYLYKTFKLQEEHNKLVFGKIINDLRKHRIDVRYADKPGNIDINGDVNVSRPGWMNGCGVVVSISNQKQHFDIKSGQDGKMILSFMGLDYRYQNKRFPVYITYKSIKIDGLDILKKPVYTWHDKPFRYELNVKNGQTVKIDIVTSDSGYTGLELAELVCKTHPNIDVDKEKFIEFADNSWNLLNTDVELIKQIPTVNSDAFISLGNACRPAYWLKKAGLRKYTLPFDWMMNYGLDLVIDSLKQPNLNWFDDFSEKPTQNSSNRVVQDNVSKMISLYHFPQEYSVSEYLPVFKSIFYRRQKRFVKILSSCKNVCFIMNRTEFIVDIFDFIKQICDMYPKTNFSVINVRQDDLSNNIIKYQLNERCILYDIHFNDINENGSDKNLNSMFWIGNAGFWTNLMQKLHVNSDAVEIEDENNIAEYANEIVGSINLLKIKQNRLEKQLNANAIDTKQRIDAIISEQKNMMNNVEKRADELNNQIIEQQQMFDTRLLETNDKLTKIQNDFIDNVNGLEQSLESNINNAINDIVSNIDIVFDKVESGIDTKISETKSRLVEIQNDLSQQFKYGISEKYLQLSNKIQNISDVNVKHISDLNKNINNVVTVHDNSLRSFVSKTADKFISKVDSKYSQLSSKIQNSLTSNSNDFKELDRNMNRIVKNGYSDLQSLVSKNTDKIVADLDTKYGKLNQNIELVSDKIISDTDTKYSQLSDNIKNFVDDNFGNIAEMKEQMQNIDKNVSTSEAYIKESVHKTQDGLQSFISKTADKFISDVDSKYGKIASVLNTQYNDLKRNIQSGENKHTSDLDKLYKKTTDIINKNSDFITDKYKQLYESMKHNEKLYNNLSQDISEIATQQNVNNNAVVEVQNLIGNLETNTKTLFKQNSEPYWANVYHDTINNSQWLKNKSVSPGRWAVSYIVLYVLYRVLDEIKPQSILECGLGQSSKLTIQYADSHNANLIICENNPEWLSFFQRQFPTADKYTKILDTEMVHIVPEYESRTYAGFKSAIQNKKFSFVLIDGPFGSEHYSRPEILDVVDNLDKTFVVMLDDMNRIGEQEIWRLLKQKLKDKGIEFVDTVYVSDKSVGLLCSPDLAYLTSL